MARHSIENDDIYLEVDSFGAEWRVLKGFKKKASCLWGGTPEVWPRHSPVLFPIVGKLNGNSYQLNERSYSLNQHGFARDHEFVLENASGNELVFLLNSNAETLRLYPFQFELRIRYSLKANALSTLYEVKNLEGSRDLPFSIGAHPGFSYDWLSQGKQWSDVLVRFHENEGTFRVLNGGLVDVSLRSKAEISARKLQLVPDLFDQDALILEKIRSRWVELATGDHDRLIRMEFDKAYAFGLWSKKVQEFICLEPWWGIADPLGHKGDLREKPGITWLKPGESWHTQWRLVFRSGDRD